MNHVHVHESVIQSSLNEAQSIIVSYSTSLQFYWVNME